MWYLMKQWDYCMSSGIDIISSVVQYLWHKPEPIYKSKVIVKRGIQPVPDIDRGLGLFLDVKG